MGMTIDDATLYMELYKRKLFNSVSDLDKDIEAYDTAIAIMRKYQIFQAKYVERLKADMVAMLEELNLEIDEMFTREINYTVDKIQGLIQSKINSLKENKDGGNNN